MPVTNLKTFFEQAYNRTEWITVLKEHLGDVTFLAKPPAVKIKTNNYNATAAELGSFETEEGFMIGLYEVSVPERAKLVRNKRTLRDLLSLEYKNTVDAALVVFYQEHSGKWRFSYVSELKTHATDPKRFTYLLGEGEKCKTIADHFAGIRKKYTDKKKPIPLAALNEVFNVSSMSKEFFDEYRELYGKFTSYLTGEDEDGNKTGRAINGFATYFPGETEQARKDARDFIKKMMGRIVFLYFLQKKGWLGVPKEEQWGAGDPEFMSKLFKDCKEPEIFYSQVLVPLFYDTLNNTERTDELFKIKPSVFKSGNYHQLKIPYLNGGLFEDDQPKTDLLVFKKELFQELFDFFDRYNFTVEEDSDREHTVAVDPEMLGHIFENLLEDNKDKGAFYTPKEIVHYMCRESLVEYLYTTLTDKCGIQEDGLREKLDAFIRNDKAAEVGDYVEELTQALYDVKICDPAIGSGAFPMGLLKEIVEAVAALAAEDQPTVRRIWKYKGEFADNLAHIKEQIIENSIYGVDIEKGAVDIARLRFWLSLVVDEDAPNPLPNLDYRIVVGNSLVSKFEEEIIEIDWDIKTKNASGVEKIVNDQQAKLYLLQVKQHEYFVAHAQKEKIRQHIRDLKIDILINQLQLSKISFQQANPVLGGYAPTAKEIQKNTENKIKIAGYDQLIQKLQLIKQTKNAPLEYFEWKLDFPDVLNDKIVKGNAGFHIVIANPPYIKEYTNRKAFDGFRQSSYYQGKMDIWYGFACKMLDFLKPKGIECFIAQNNWITSAGASIFRDKVLTDAEIRFFTDFGNYKVFETAGIQTMIYLIQKASPRSEYEMKYSVLKNDRINKTELIEFLDFTAKNIHSEKYRFKLNSVALKNKPFTFNNNEATNLLVKIKDKGNFCLIEKEVAQGIVFPQDFVNKKSKEKLKEKVEVGDGIFVLKKAELKHLNLDSFEKKLIKPYFTTKELGRYYGSPNNELWLIYTGSEFKNIKSMQPYPILKKHLDRFKSVITSDNKPYGLHRSREERFFKGESIVAQRKCAQRPSFTYTDFNCYVSATFYVIQTGRINMKYLTALLNSRIVEYWLRNKGKMQGDNFQIDKEPLLAIPLLKPNDKTSVSIEKIVDKILELKAQKKSTQKLEQQIDQLFYRLYDLSYDEAKVIDPALTLTNKDYEAITIE